MSADTGLLFVVTKYSWLYICDMESATYLTHLSLSSDIIFSTTLNTLTQGLLVINTAGQVN